MLLRFFVSLPRLSCCCLSRPLSLLLVRLIICCGIHSFIRSFTGNSVMHCRVSDFCRVAADRDLLRRAITEAPEVTRALEPLFAQRLVADDGAALRAGDLCRVLLGNANAAAGTSVGLLQLCGDADPSVASSARRLLHPVLASLEPPPPPPPAAALQQQQHSPDGSASIAATTTTETPTEHEHSPSRSMALVARALAQSIGQEGRVCEAARAVIAALLQHESAHDVGPLCVVLYALLSLDSPDAPGAWSACVLSLETDAQQRLVQVFVAAFSRADPTTSVFVLALARSLVDVFELPLPDAIADVSSAPKIEPELAPLFCPTGMCCASARMALPS